MTVSSARGTFWARVSKPLCALPDLAARKEDGIALVTTLLLLSLFSIIGLAMVVSTSSDMLINGYYSNYRGAFYAADSGLNIARQQLANQISAAVPATFANPPISATAATTVQNYVSTNYGASFVALNTGQAASSWGTGGSFEITNVTFSQASCTDNQTGNCATDTTATTYGYVYNYSLTSSGRALASQTAKVTEKGTLTLNIIGTSPSQSMAGYGMFIDQFPVCSGAYLVPGTITGPVFTNGGWTFGTSGSYIFTDLVQSHSSTFGYDMGSCYTSSPTSPNGSYTHSGQTINPQFQGGFQLGQGTASLPVNDFIQKYAVIDGQGTGETNTNPTNAQWHTLLNAGLTDGSTVYPGVKKIDGTAYPTGGATSGVYLPYNNTTKTFTGGGIYVEGDATVHLSTGTDSTSSHNPTQIYTITQGSTTTTITTNIAANTTTVAQSGSTTLNLTGVPANQNLGSPATMLYVNGDINDLRGPGQGVAAVQDGAAITVTALNDITITGDLLYKTEPVTIPGDALVSGGDKGQALGLFTATGNINLQNGQANNNLEIDASLATISQGGSGGLVNTGDAIDTLNIVGGRIQNSIQDINANTRNVYFDRRFTPGTGFAPPWFPSTTLTGATVSNPQVTSVQRISWVVSPTN